MYLILDIALSHLLRRRRQTFVSLLGVGLGVGFFIAMAALMQGFQREFVSRVIDVAPHVTVMDEMRRPPMQPTFLFFTEGAVELVGAKPKDEPRGIRSARELIRELSETPGVHVAPTLSGPVFLRYGTRERSVTLVGIDPEVERRVTNIERDIIAGSLDSLRTVANGIILGVLVAERLGAEIGTTLTVVSTNGTVLPMKVVGIVQSGITSLDQTLAYGLLKKAQILQGRINVINQIRMRLDDVERSRAIASAIEARWGYRSEPWEESQSNILRIFVIQDGIMYSTVGAIMLVACFGIFNIISTVIYEKTRDIAILKSIGFHPGDIQLIFILEGLMVGVLGTLLGWALGYGLVELLGTVELPSGGFMKTQGFVLYKTWKHYALSGGIAITVATFAGWIPSRRGARVNPVEIVRGAV